MGCLGAYLFDQSDASKTHGSGGWGIGELFIFVVIGVSGFFLGLIAVIIAFLRRERFIPLQIVMALINLVAVSIVVGFFRR